MVFNVFGKFLDSNEKEVAKLAKIVEKINSFEETVGKLADGKLTQKTAEFKLRFERGEALDEILPEAYACVREAARRTIGERHYDVQLIAAIALHQGKIAEQRTGEGKTLSASASLYLNSLTDRGCHLVTVNDYLARVGLGWMGPIYELLGVSASCIMHDAAFIFDSSHEDSNQTDWRLKHLKLVSKKEAYQADITYGTNNEFGFDYLRDNMVWQKDQMAQRGQHFAIVDEVDSILIDEARTPLIISAPAGEATDEYYKISGLIGELNPATDYTLEEKTKTANLTEHGITKVEKKLGIDNLYEKDFETVHHIEQALRAQIHYHRDRDYVVKDGEVIIVDEFTGRLLPGRRYSEGLHQAIEAKEGLKVQQESNTLATISFQNYFRLYEKLAGMTGTAVTEAAEFHKIYGLEVAVVPTNEPMIRIDHSDVVYKTAKAKFTAVANDVAERNLAGQPVLIGTTSIEKNELLSSLLKHKGVPHAILNAKNHQKEAEIISQAGEKGAVTLATNIAGRGVDIILGGTRPMDEAGRPKLGSAEWKDWQKRHQEVIKLGGLHVTGTERHESRRIDNQLRGRSGRQGDPGSSRFYVSLEDDIMRLFGGDQIAKIMGALRLPEDTPIEHRMVSKAIENAQTKVEGHNFDIRKHLVEYDDVMNKQREIIYGMRRKIVESTAGEKETGKDEKQKREEKSSEFREEILEKIHREVENLVGAHSAEVLTEKEKEEIVKDFSTIIPFDEKSQKQIVEEIKKISDLQKIVDFFDDLAKKVYQSRQENLGPEMVSQIERFVMISVIDTLWMEHLDTLDDLREGIGLRGYGQRDPLVEYKHEAFDLFEKLVASIDYEIVRRIFKIQVGQPEQTRVVQEQVPEVEVETSTVGSTFAEPPTHQTVEQVGGEVISQRQPVHHQKIGRNDPCWCGSGKKWKKCHYPNLN